MALMFVEMVQSYPNLRESLENFRDAAAERLGVSFCGAPIQITAPNLRLGERGKIRWL